MKKLIDFSDRVVGMVKEVVEKEGHKTFSGAVHAIISQYYDKKYFTKYSGSKKSSSKLLEPVEPELKVYTTAEACEFFGGKVDMFNLKGRTCLAPVDRVGKVLRTAPLTAMGIVSQYGDFTIDNAKVVETPITSRSL